MPSVNIVLIEPQIPQNTGNIARTCAATGAALHLVRPMGFEVDDRKLKRAGLDYWHLLDITYYSSFGDFCAKNGGPNSRYVFFTTKAKKCYTDFDYSGEKDVFLIFGREDKGLPEELLLENEERCARIPMLNDLRSLNLSNSAAIGVYEVLRQNNFENLKTIGKLTKYNW